MNLVSYELLDNKLLFILSDKLNGEELILAIRPEKEQERYHLLLLHCVNDGENRYYINLDEIVKNIIFDVDIYFDLVLLNNMNGRLDNVYFTKNDANRFPILVNDFNNQNISIKEMIDKSNRPSFIVNKTVNKPIFVKVNKDSKKISFSSTEYTFQLARRAKIQKKFVFDCVVDLSKGEDVDFDFAYESVDKYVRNGKEIWDIVANKDGIIFPVICEDDINCNYQPVNDGFDAKLFISEKKYLSLWTKEGINAKQPKVKVCVIGSCYTKQAFHAIDFTNIDYKRYYENNCIIFHTTFESQFSNPVHIEDNMLFPCLHEKIMKLYGYQEFKKDMLPKIKEYKPDYIIIDLFNESRSSIYELKEDKSYVTDVFFFENSPIKNTLSKHPLVKPIDSRRIPLFSDAIQKFKNEIEKILPLSNIILVKAKATTKYLDKDKKTLIFENPKWIINADALWEKYNHIFTTIIPECRYINLTNKEYLGMVQELGSPFTLSSNHFQGEYYKDVMNEFNKIVLQDLIRRGRL